ncbi:peroxisomal membrane protein PEX13 [Aplysia californica]|uniref:Peroxisomal membrane protein PEX13 n=1 Tax=Aplysia californica TaxID=6500 RepID=A0ABM1A0S3_APLCA|nr:peroxisomal membrane protein PEX13 [Aplysia californica]
MAAPVKPWERPGINYQNNAPLPSSSMSGVSSLDSVQRAAGSGISPISAVSSDPPQLPPRPSQQQSSLNSRLGTGYGYSGFGGYGSYGGYSSPMGFGGYGGMYNSPYSSYGSYGYNRMGNDMNSSFARHAEESSRPAFESIESIVSAVNSVGMMLDSTFQAVYNSFRAVIGVADNFSRLKTQLVQVFSALAFIRTLRYLFRRLLELLRLRPKGEADRQWMEAFKDAAVAAAAAGPDGAPKKSSWPILMFFGIIMGGPYLIWKVISAFSSTPDEKGWTTGLDDHFVARANYNFQGQGEEELSFTAGQNINIAPKELQPRVRGWLLASVDGKTTGMIPANYVTILGKRRGTKSSAPSQQQPPLRQSDSSMALSQESRAFNPAPPPQLASSTIPETELESVFDGTTSLPPSSGANATIAPVTSSANQDFLSSARNSSNQEASEILNDVDEVR